MGLQRLHVDVMASAETTAKQVADVEREVAELARRGCMFSRKGAYSLMYCTREGRPQQLEVSDTKHPTQQLPPLHLANPEKPEVAGTYTHCGSWNSRPLYACGDCRIYVGRSGNWRVATSPDHLKENLAVMTSSRRSACEPQSVEAWVIWNPACGAWIPSSGRISVWSESTPPPSPWRSPEESTGTPPTRARAHAPHTFPTPHFGNA